MVENTEEERVTYLLLNKVTWEIKQFNDKNHKNMNTITRNPDVSLWVWNMQGAHGKQGDPE